MVEVVGLELNSVAWAAATEDEFEESMLGVDAADEELKDN